MLSSLLPGFLSQPHKNHAVPSGQRVYGIGDIHGCLSLLQQLLTLIREDHLSAPSSALKMTLVFLGDYIDRGPDSAGVLDCLIDLQSAGIEAVFVKGNHEASLLQFLADPEENITWLDWGGDETLQSYGLKDISIREPHDLAASLKNAMPSRHLAFLRSLPLHYECGDFIFVHAGLKPGVPLEEQSERDLLWIREPFHRAKASLRPDKTVIHGHAATRKIVDKGWRVCIDTGAVWTGALSAIVLEGKTRRFIATTPETVPERT